MNTASDQGADAMLALQSDQPISRTSHHKQAMFPVDHRLLVALNTVLLFLWRMSNHLADILVQKFKKPRELDPFAAQVVQMASSESRLCKWPHCVSLEYMAVGYYELVACRRPENPLPVANCLCKHCWGAL